MTGQAQATDQEAIKPRSRVRRWIEFLLGMPYADDLKELSRAHRQFVRLGAIGLAAIVGYSVFGAARGLQMNFLVWGVMAAFGSLFAGIALGLLFGLPTVRPVTFTNMSSNAGSQAGSDRNTPLGYSESTNLEQVADWLTKIIIGLTLTQYGGLESRFARLSYDLTCSLKGGCGALPIGRDGDPLYRAGSTMPGGFLMVFFATLGFLVAYLWMRGHFISEMEAAKSIAIRRAKADEIAALQKRIDDATAELGKSKNETDEALKSVADTKAELEAARDAAALQKTRAEQFEIALEGARRMGVGQIPPTERKQDGPAPAEAAATIAQNAVDLASGDPAKRVAEAVAKKSGAEDTTDPWKNAFGGQSKANGLTLSAAVKQREDNPNFYDVALDVAADPAAGDVEGKKTLFYLHPTFGPDPRVAAFSQGHAKLEIIAYGAFTVGALVDSIGQSGPTRLELDLVEVAKDYPGFLSR